MKEYVGAIHIHSVYSDGTGEIKDIAEAAGEAGLDFIIITDHNTLRALKEGHEKWHNNVLTLVGCEINDKENKNHYLALGIEEPPSTRMPAKDYTRIVKEKGGIGFIAHPHEKRSAFKEHPAYPWTEWNIESFDGIEIWNHMSEWVEGLTEENKFQWFVHPLKSIVGPTSETLKVWDELNLRRKAVGIGGCDAHAHKVNFLGFFEVEIFPYKVLFKAVRTHILADKDFVKGEPKDFGKAKAAVYKALKEGRCFISNYYYGDASGFRFFAESEKKIYQMGDSFPFENKIKLRVILPNLYGQIRLIRNGELYDSLDNFDAEFIISEPGAYRVEVYLDGKAWIYSNHIRIGL